MADESVDYPIVLRLRQAGHEVHSIAESRPAAPDHAVLELANSNQTVLLTADKDFGEAVFRLHLHSWGVVLIRLAGLAAEAKAERVITAVSAHGPDFVKAFAVLTHNALRIRHLSH